MDARQGKLAQYGLRRDRRKTARRDPDGVRSGFAAAILRPRFRIPPARPGERQGSPMPNITSLARFTVPLGRQDFELQEVVHDAGGMRLLRVRIREKSRFTIFDVDPVTAQRWGEAMRRWGDAQPEGQEPPPVAPAG